MLVSAALSATSEASVLPLLVDNGRGDTAWAWWAVPLAPSTPDLLLGALIEAHGASDSRWLVPSEVRPREAPSALLLRADIPPTNARSLADLYGADLVLTGRFGVLDESTVPWLGLERCEVGLEASLLSVASGSVRATPTLSASAYRPDRESACEAAGALLLSLVSDYIPEAGERPVGRPVEGVEIVVRSPQSAMPYVAWRTALREASPLFLDVVERWASEGQVGIEVILEPGADPLTVEAAIDAMDRSGSDYRVVTIERLGDQIMVSLSFPASETR